ncbi:nuclear envelope integral membrane protein 1a-like [Anneissia japonica]|uniref:nuclear envelope integral membrane protein 1a-like n=1 Tax=Anneissia japonica TaxID=1529436 RepID=UPI0014255A32|nr:nuclear envelope integral membrane protein 1a-like [Anneissia japonica]
MCTKHHIILFSVIILFIVTSFQIGSTSSKSVDIGVPFKVEVHNPDSGCKIYCVHPFETVGPANIWKTIKVQATCSASHGMCSNPGVIVGESEDALEGSCTKGWLPSYAPWESNYASLSPFRNSCFAVVHDAGFKLDVNAHSAYLNYMALFIFGIILFFTAPTLSQNVLFYYSSGIGIGIIASLLVLVYILSRMVPKRSSAFAVVVVGWSGALYILHWVFENITNGDYQNYVFGYIAMSALISFVVCYYYGPNYHERAQNLVQWAIQLCALLCIHQSTHDEHAAVAMIVGLLFVKNFPYKIFHFSLSKFRWKWKSHKKRRFLTEEEYEEQARKETLSALEELRNQCLSPQVETWKMVSRLESPKRFAQFVLGDSHLSGDELDAYDSDISMLEDDEDNTSDIMTDDLSLLIDEAEALI